MDGDGGLGETLGHMGGGAGDRDGTGGGAETGGAGGAGGSATQMPQTAVPANMSFWVAVDETQAAEQRTLRN